MIVRHPARHTDLMIRGPGRSPVGTIPTPTAAMALASDFNLGAATMLNEWGPSSLHSCLSFTREDSLLVLIHVPLGHRYDKHDAGGT